MKRLLHRYIFGMTMRWHLNCTSGTGKKNRSLPSFSLLLIRMCSLEESFICTKQIVSRIRSPMQTEAKRKLWSLW